MNRPTNIARRGIIPDRSGATAVEMAVVLLAVILFTFGIMEFGIALWDFNSAEKATQLGVRRAAVSDPVASGLNSYDGTFDGTGSGQAEVCFTAGCAPIVCTEAVCTPNTLADGTGLSVDLTALDLILQDMRNIMPRIARSNVIVEYAPVADPDDPTRNQLGFAGRPGGPVPRVTVRLTGMTYNFILLNAFLGSNTIPMCCFNATLIGEELNTAAVP